MKVLLIAYACEPGAGSEAGAGWEWARAAAEHHCVWLVTRSNNAPAIEHALERGEASRIHPVYVNGSDVLRRLKKRPGGLYPYYLSWHRSAARRCQDLHRDVGFDIAHHLTFAVDWLPSAAASLEGVPFIWGPVGGATRTHWRMWRYMGVRAVASDVGRDLIGGAGRRLFGDRMARRAAVVVGLNTDVARRFPEANVVVEPNVALGEPPTLPCQTRERPRTQRRAVFVGRLLAWKGVLLAIRTLAQPAAAGWDLDIYGDGPDRARAERLADRLGVGDRVRILGSRPRAELLAGLTAADAMLFPSVHDSAPWAVAEAAAAGLPVVCLDRGGPPELAGLWACAVSTRGHLPRRLAEALAGVQDQSAAPRPNWTTYRLPGLLNAWYEAVSES